MGLYIRDDTVNDLADQLAKATGQTKTQAVREALEVRIRALAPPAQPIAPPWLAEIQAQARAAGFGPDPDFDMKAFMDDLSGGI